MTDPLVRALGAVNLAVSSQDVDRLAVCANTVALVGAMLPLVANYLDGVDDGDVATIRATLSEASVRISNATLGWAEPPVDLAPISALERPGDWLRLVGCAIGLRETSSPAELLRKGSDLRVTVAALEAILDLAPDADLRSTLELINAPRRRRLAA